MTTGDGLMYRNSYTLCVAYVALLLAAAASWGAAPACAAQASGPPPNEPPPNESVLNDSFVRVEGRQGLNLLYNMEFARAEAIFDRIDRRYPEHPIGPFLSALSIWWQIMLDLDDTAHDEAFYEAMDEVIDRADRMLRRDEDSYDAAFFKAAALGFRGRLRSNRGQWFRAALDGKRALDYVLDLSERDPQNDDFAFGMGMYDYFAAVIPERYPYAKPVMIFFPEGDREAGLQKLERTAEEGWFIQTEAAYFLTQIYYRFENDFDKSREYISWLRRKHPDNPFFHNFEGRIYARWGRWQEARAIFEEVLARHEAGAPGYNDAMAEQALYYTARSWMVQDEYRTALNYLARLEKMTANGDADSFYRVLGRLRQGMIYDALGKRTIARSRYESVLGMEDHAGAHDRARQYLEDPFEG